MKYPLLIKKKKTCYVLYSLSISGLYTGYQLNTLYVYMSCRQYTVCETKYLLLSSGSKTCLTVEQVMHLKS